MRITVDQRIAGYPAVQIRKLMRETVGRSITPRYVREILQCSDSAATRPPPRPGFCRAREGPFGAVDERKCARDGYRRFIPPA
jgi:hypothetical protein